MTRNHRYLPLFLPLIALFFCAAASALERKDIPDRYKMRSDDLYPSIAAWETAFDSIHARLTRLNSFKGTLAATVGEAGARNLIAFNRLNERTYAEVSRVTYYAYYGYEVCMSDPDWINRWERAGTVWSEYYQTQTWAEPELLTIPPDTLLKWTAVYPELKPYQQPYADMFALRSHSLSEPEERILALAGELAGGPQSIFQKMTGVDLDFPVIANENGDSIQTGFSLWREGWRTNPNRRLREDFYQAVFGRYKQFANTFAEMISAHYKTDVFYTRARNFENTLQANLAPTFVPEAVFNNLVQATRANLAPFQKFAALRKRVLNLPHYYVWDEHVGLGAQQEQRSSWEDAAQIVVEALKPLGNTYTAEVRQLLDPANGKVDPFTSKDKIAGGWSHNSLEESARMVFNFDYEKGLTQDNIRTISHEAGHSQHANYTQQFQPIPLRVDVTLVAEVPSTVNETLLSMKLLDDARANYDKASGADKETARQRLIYLLDEALMNGRDALYRSVLIATWEREAHRMAEEGTPITQESLTKLYADLMAEFYGPALETDDLTNVFWAAYPHLYLGYYTYSYAVGEVASVAIAKNIRAAYNGDKSKRDYVGHYLNFLKAGSSKHPVELLQDAGVDMTTSAPVEEYVRYYNELVDELDRLTKKS